ncbi:MAG: metallophosphoesterase family protein, partial [Gammaproteobacteria bacterium]
SSDLVVVHGHQWPRAGTRHAKLRARWPAARAIVYGHSHRRIVDNDHAPWVLNPGAAGRARTYGGASWLGLAVDRDCWQVAEGEFPRDTGARRAAVSRINEEEGR